MQTIIESEYREDRFLAGLYGEKLRPEEQSYIDSLDIKAAHRVLMAAEVPQNNRRGIWVTPYEPIHNRYYAVWIIGTAIAIWVVHHFHL